MQILTLLFLFLFGLVFGSFVNALVWRLRKQDELSNREKAKKSVSKKTQRGLSEYSILKGRSMCTDCGHVLASKDLIPVFSWLSLKGECRYCHKHISWQYPLVEILTALLFVVSYIFWPYALNGVWWLAFAAWLGIVVVFVALTVYDMRWQELPDKLVGVAISLSIVLSAIIFIHGIVGWNGLLQVLLSVCIIFGLFWVLFQISDGAWIGGGDVKLAIALGLIVSLPIRAMLVIFISSFVGTLFALPRIVRDRKNLKTVIPYGPLLILATIIVFLFGNDITTWYESLFLLS